MDTNETALRIDGSVAIMTPEELADLLEAAIIELPLTDGDKEAIELHVKALNGIDAAVKSAASVVNKISEKIGETTRIHAGPVFFPISSVTPEIVEVEE